MTAPVRRRRRDFQVKESVIQEACRQLYQHAGATVYWLSQFRKANQTPGLPDLWVAAPAVGVAFWHEVKPPTRTRREQRTGPQIRFARECEAAGVGYIVGGLAAAKAKLVAVGLAQIIAGQFTLTPRRVVL